MDWLRPWVWLALLFTVAAPVCALPPLAVAAPPAAPFAELPSELLVALFPLAVVLPPRALMLASLAPPEP